MSPLARLLLALACAALLRAACARHRYLSIQPTAWSSLQHCGTADIGNTTVQPSRDKTVQITQFFNYELGLDEYLIHIKNYCSGLVHPDGLGTKYVMARETVTACANTAVVVTPIGHDEFSPVVVSCDDADAEKCGKLAVTVDQYCELKPIH